MEDPLACLDMVYRELCGGTFSAPLRMSSGLTVCWLGVTAVSSGMLTTKRTNIIRVGVVQIILTFIFFYEVDKASFLHGPLSATDLLKVRFSRDLKYSNTNQGSTMTQQLSVHIANKSADLCLAALSRVLQTVGKAAVVAPVPCPVAEGF